MEYTEYFWGMRDENERCEAWLEEKEGAAREELARLGATSKNFVYFVYFVVQYIQPQQGRRFGEAVGT